MKGNEMKIVMSIAAIHDGVLQGTMHKEFDSLVIPIPGIEVEDLAWESSVKIDNVTVNFGSDCYYVFLKPLRIKNTKEYNQIKEAYKLSGWKISDE
jgi:hypothetical protein